MTVKIFDLARVNSIGRMSELSQRGLSLSASPEMKPRSKCSCVNMKPAYFAWLYRSSAIRLKQTKSHRRHLSQHYDPYLPTRKSDLSKPGSTPSLSIRVAAICVKGRR